LLIKIIPWDAIAIASLRSFVASLLLLIYIGPRSIRINRKTIMIGVFLAICMISFVAATKLTTAINAIMLQYTCPVFTLLIAALFFKVKINKSDVFIVILAMSGIALFFMEKLSVGGLAGNLLALLSGIVYACVFIFAARCDDDAVHGIFLGHVLCFLVGLPFLTLNPPVLNGTSVAIVIVMGVFQIGLPHIIFGEVIRYVPAFDATIITMIEPLINPVLVFIGMGEAPGALALIGAIVVLTAIILKSWLGIRERNTVKC